MEMMAEFSCVNFDYLNSSVSNFTKLLVVAFFVSQTTLEQSRLVLTYGAETVQVTPLRRT